MDPVSSTDFAGKVAFITGGSRGIGAATASAFARAGASVAVFSRKQEGLDAVVAEIESLGAQGLALAGHAGHPAEIQEAVEKTVARFGRLDVLVNNAATNPHFGPVMDCTESLWDKIFEVNVKGFFFAAQACVPHLEKTGGAIVNVASTAGLKPTPLMGVYSISKAAVIHMTKVLARELGSRNIRVNAVAPGLIKTRFSQALWDNEAIMADVMTRHAVPRIGEPQEVAQAILYMASQAAGYVTGSVMVVDGGELLF